MGTHPGRRLLPLLLAAGLVLGGCGRHVVGIPVANQRPIVSLTGGPAPLSDVLYNVRWRWTATDPDGHVVEFQYAIDPAPDRDTVWTRSATSEVTLQFSAHEPQDPLPPVGQRITARDQHTFVLRVRDNEGMYSARATRVFSSRTIVPASSIQNPSPSPLATLTLTAVDIRWSGIDYDGPTGKPVLYRFKLFKAFEIAPTTPDYVASNRAQEFLEAEALNGFAGWDSTGADSTAIRYEGLDPGRTYLFAVSGQDEAGAIETRFLTSSNVVQFRPTLDKLAPRITLTNPYFSYSMSGGVSLVPSRIIQLEVPADVPIPMTWSATPGAGAQVAGYRWAVDMANQDITDETARTDDEDVHHWSTWSLDETSAVLGPFAGSPDGPVIHYLYVMARDNLGFASLFTLQMNVIHPTRTRDLLVVDDRLGPLGGTGGAYPTEAEEDTFYYAVGGFPIPGTGVLSVPGAFAGVDYDTLDYRSRLTEIVGYGLPLSLLDRYRAVAWYTDAASATVGPGTAVQPLGTALRYMNQRGHQNSLALFLAQGGKVFLFGEGVPNAIVNGLYDNSGSFRPAPPWAGNVLRAGCFLYDYIHLRSRITVSIAPSDMLRGAIPYLPEFRGPATQADRTHDPRIGPGAERTATRWTGLPRLSLASYRNAPTDPSLMYVKSTWTVSLPLNVFDGTSTAPIAALDTLYLHQARDYFPAGSADGTPSGIHYHGMQHGEVVWLGFPLHYFEPDQARTLVRRVMTEFGLPVDEVGAATLSARGAGRAPTIRGDR